MARNTRGRQADGGAPAAEAEAPSEDQIIAEAMAAAGKMKNPALRLTLPGAPLTPHHVPGVAGLYRSDIPTPVGGDGELPLEAAVRASINPSLHLELVECKDPERAREINRADTKAAREGIGAARRAMVGSDTPTEEDRINDEIKAVGL